MSSLLIDCDAYLTHDSAPGRQQHIRGWKHREAFKQHYQKYFGAFMQRQQQQIQMAGDDYHFTLVAIYSFR